MKVIADGKSIPGVESVYADHLYLGDTKRNALHLKLGGALDAETWEALLCGSIAVGEGAEAVTHEGYNAVHDCLVTLLRQDDAERTVNELSGQLTAAEAKAGQIQAALDTAVATQGTLLRALAPKMTDAEVLALDPVWPEWQPDTEYIALTVLQHGGKLYRVVQPHTSQGNQEPGSEGMLAIYRPVQAEPPEGEELPWASGEEVVQGDRRSHNGVVYECTNPNGAGANTYTPDQVPAVWTVVTA